jgi:hypothetical protein
MGSGSGFGVRRQHLAGSFHEHEHGPDKAH